MEGRGEGGFWVSGPMHSGGRGRGTEEETLLVFFFGGLVYLLLMLFAKAEKASRYRK